MLTKQQLSKKKDWYYPYITSMETMKLSGWKLYIYGETVDDSIQVTKLLESVAGKYNFTMKVASQGIINRNEAKRNVAWSIGVIYLHAELFSEKKIKSLLDDINSSLKDYTKTGVIKGAKAINKKVYYRYDLKTPVKPDVGVLYEEHYPLYRGEAGDFNIPGNPDITEYF